MGEAAKRYRKKMILTNFVVFLHALFYYISIKVAKEVMKLEFVKNHCYEKGSITCMNRK